MSTFLSMSLYDQIGTITIILMFGSSPFHVLSFFLLPKGLKNKVMRKPFYNEFTISILNQFPGKLFFHGAIASFFLVPASFSKRRYGSEKIVFELRKHVPLWYKILVTWTMVVTILAFVLLFILFLMNPSILLYRFR